MTDRLSLTGLRVFARHGVLAAEAEHGQLFVVDIHLELSLLAAGTSDALEDTVDYGKLAQLIHDVVEGERWNLIERVAQRVAEVVLSDHRITGVDVTIHKPHAPIGVAFDDVSVSLTRRR